MCFREKIYATLSEKGKALSENVIPAKAGIHNHTNLLDSRLRGSDRWGIIRGSLNSYGHLCFACGARRKRLSYVAGFQRSVRVKKGGCTIKELIKKIPILRSLARVVYYRLIAPFKSFPGSGEYWKQRYKSGETSGVGSYLKFAEFKAEILNSFVKDKQITTVIEYGCGDGNQLRLATYPLYIGFDVSPDALLRCKELFYHDKTKTFTLMGDYANETAQLTVSLDVIYHLIEDNVFFDYIKRLFDSSKQFVIIYSSNTDKQAKIQAAHIRHRMFSKWIEKNRPEWKLMQHIPNRYPYLGDDQGGSRAAFYLYEKA